MNSFCAQPHYVVFCRVNSDKFKCTKGCEVLADVRLEVPRRGGCGQPGLCKVNGQLMLIKARANN